MKKVCKEFFNFFFCFCDSITNILMNVSLITTATGLIFPDTQNEKIQSFNKFIESLNPKNWCKTK